jgi:adenylate cyclase
MAELEALYENKEQNVRNGWRNPLPANQPIKLGRVHGQADWWMNDGLISAFHATVQWDGERLTVTERTDPPPTNRIYYQSRPQPTFAIAPGDSFVIGNTVFMLHAGSASTIAADRPDVTIPAEATFTRAQLRQVPFDTSATFLRALEQVPDVLRLANDEDMLFRNMVKVGLDALPHADALAVVQIPPEATENDKRVLVRTHQQRMAGKAETFMPSRRLAFRAVRQEKKSVLHVWIGEKNENMTIRMDSHMPGVPWAICTPFKDDSGWGLYADGRLPKEPAVERGQVRDKELTDYQKVIELVAGLIESTRKAHQLDRQLTLYRRFIPRRLWNDASAEQLDEILHPRLTTATVLFCDIRGSCKYAEDGEMNLEETWFDLATAIDDMTNIISGEDGIVAGFQGDAVMAFWGWPDNMDDQIERAAKAALKIRRRFDQLGWRKDLSCGIGIAHGQVMAGRMGASELAKVDVFGPTVNLASRLESLTKQFGARILLDESAAKYLSEKQWRQGRVRRLGRFIPKGMTKGTVLSELLPPEHEPVQGNIKEAVRRSWEEALGWFLAGEWGQARNRFEQFFGNDPAARQLLDHMAKTNGTPPKDWAEKPDIVLESK